MHNPSFARFGFAGTLHDDADISVIGIRGYAEVPMYQGAYFVYVHRGVCLARGDVALTAGMYGCVNWGNLVIMSGSEVLVVFHKHHQAMHTFGGPVEERGRLTYIDGCTDSLLVPPVRKGDPCLNLMYFPKNISQRSHTHPSIRVGVVAEGYGECITPFGNSELRTGDVFLIYPENGETAMGLDGQYHRVGTHAFRTGNNTMRIVAFHPDSVAGPTDESHQMLNATVVDGTPANELPR